MQSAAPHLCMATDVPWSMDCHRSRKRCQEVATPSVFMYILHVDGLPWSVTYSLLHPVCYMGNMAARHLLEQSLARKNWLILIMWHGRINRSWVTRSLRLLPYASRSYTCIDLARVSTSSPLRRVVPHRVLTSTRTRERDSTKSKGRTTQEQRRVTSQPPGSVWSLWSRRRTWIRG